MQDMVVSDVTKVNPSSLNLDTVEPDTVDLVERESMVVGEVTTITVLL